MEELKNIIDKYTEGNYLISKSDKENMFADILNLFDVSGSASDRPQGLENDEWYCPNCKCVVPPHEVTNDERHGIEGCLVKVI